jgi:DNA-binding IclR family transcriptional regulator
VPGRHPLLAVSAIGSSRPLRGSASGKILLAALPEKKLQTLREQLVLEPFRMGISAVGIAPRAPTDEVAAVSLSVPTDRFTANEEGLAGTLLDQAKALQRRV